MAQFLDLTGLGYFKNKLLSSAFQYSYSFTDSDADDTTINLQTNNGLFIGASIDLSSQGESWRSGFTTSEDTEWTLYNKGSATLFSQDINTSYYQSIVTANPNHLRLGVLNGDSTPYYSTIDLDRNGIITIESSAENMNGDQDLYQNIAHLQVSTDDINGVFELKAYTDGQWGSDPEWGSNTILITGNAANGLTINSGATPIVINSNNFNLTNTSASFYLGTGTNHNFTVASNNFQVASNGDISKIRQLKGGSGNYIWFSGNDIIFHNGQGNEINLATIIANIYTCLRGDTSYITMADRSRKLIQDIKPGDVVLSYDINKKDYCEAVVLANDMTGMESRFDTFVFENGATVDVYGDEPFIFEASDVLTLGTIQKLYDYHTKGDDRRWVLTHTPGAKARVIRKFSSVVCEEPVGRYMLVTSNGAFFVNGMLKGNMSNFIDSYYKKRRNKLPDNIQTFLTEISHKLATFDNGLEDDHVDATILKQMEIKWSAVHSAKQFLTATDYKAMKYAEGAMTEEEWLPIKAQRAEMRAVINENEAEITELRKQLPENLKQPTWIGKAQIWAEGEGILNDHLQDFKDFINSHLLASEEE